jgi:hypothetical protein
MSVAQWNSFAYYNVGDQVQDGASTYYDALAANTNKQPSISPSFWAVVAPPSGGIQTIGAGSNIDVTSGSNPIISLNSTVSLTGSLSAGSATLTGAVIADSATLTNDLSANSALLSGALSANSAAISTSLSATTATLSGSLLADTVAVSNALTAGSATITNSISSYDATISNDLTTGSLLANFSAEVRDLTVNNNTIMFGALEVDGGLGTFKGGITCSNQPIIVKNGVGGNANTIDTDGSISTTVLVMENSYGGITQFNGSGMKTITVNRVKLTSINPYMLVTPTTAFSIYVSSIVLNTNTIDFTVSSTNAADASDFAYMIVYH